MKNQKYLIPLLVALLIFSFLGCNLIEEDNSLKKKKITFNTIIEEIEYESGTIKIKKSERAFMIKWVPSELKVSDKKLLENVKSGDIVFLTVEGTQENAIVYKIEKIEPEESITNTNVINSNSNSEKE